jgi:uncharacterized protein
MTETGPVEAGYEAGLALIGAGAYFEAHEELEQAWRSCDASERDFFQGLVHVAVAWYQCERRNRVGCERQLEKATRRLGRYAPHHRGLRVDALLDGIAAARGQFPDLPPVVINRCQGSRGRG